MPDVLSEALDLVDDVAKCRARDRLRRFYFRTPGNVPGAPYLWQKRFHDLGKTCSERMLMAANRVGKSMVCGAEVAIHLTGLYPSWWEGRRFDHPVRGWAIGETNETVRDIIQSHLFGEIIEGRRPEGDAWIPHDRIGTITFRNCAVRNVIDTVKVKHACGEWSSIQMKSYEQGVSKFQGVALDFVWADEEPEDSDIYAELQTRLLDRKGILLASRTPLYGMTPWIEHFMQGGDGIAIVTATWDDAPHIGQQEKDRLKASYPDHEVETRTLGVPMMGQGLIYNVPDKMIACEPFQIPPHFARIAGCDFGIDHPAAGSWVAWDRDKDIVYVYDCYKESGQIPPYHAARFRGHGTWIPVAWPHDGNQREKGTGRPFMLQYVEAGANMLHLSANYEDNKAGAMATEPIVNEILQRMRTGRFKVFDNLNQWFEEKRMYHRKDGLIVRNRDDIMSATHYAVAMLRHACTEAQTARFDQAVDDYNPLAAFLRR